MAEGIIYDMFDADKHVQKITDFFRRLKDGEAICKLRLWYAKRNCFLQWNKGNNGKWYCVREYYYSGVRKENRKQMENMQMILKSGWMASRSEQ